jgi:hypothetical protein
MVFNKSTPIKILITYNIPVLIFLCLKEIKSHILRIKPAYLYLGMQVKIPFACPQIITFSLFPALNKLC